MSLDEATVSPFASINLLLRSYYFRDVHSRWTLWAAKNPYLQGIMHHLFLHKFRLLGTPYLQEEFILKRESYINFPFSQ
jgi:hypothetical protein